MSFYDILLAKKLEDKRDPQVKGLTVTENGSYSETGTVYNVVNVNLPLDEKVITENGTYNASADNLQGYNKVVVNVAGYKLKDAPSGSISTFTDGVDLPLNKLVVGIDSQSGVSECNLTRCGNNLFNLDSKISTTYANVIYTSDANFVTLNGVKSGGGYANFSSAKITLPANTYYAKAFVISGTCISQSNVELYLYDGNSNVTSNIINTEREITLSEETTVNLRFAIWRDNTVFDKYKLGVIISTNHITEYNTYNGNTYNIPFPAGVTISNGSIDILNGVLTDDDLSEEYNINPIAIRSLEGVNNIFADTGDILEGEYFAAL